MGGLRYCTSTQLPVEVREAGQGTTREEYWSVLPTPGEADAGSGCTLGVAGHQAMSV